MRKIIAALTLAAAGTTPALAQDAPDKPFEGASITAITGVDDSRWFDGGRAGILYGGQLGYDWQDRNLILGAEAEITGSSGRHCFSIQQPGGGGDRYCVKSGRDLYIGAKVGYAVGEATSLYLKGGYTNARQAWTRQIGGVGPLTKSGSGSADGFRVGAGIEQRLGGALIAKAEYRYSNYDGAYSRHQGVVGLGIRF